MTQSVRTRFAPSPTGYLHVGGIRTALFAFLVARQAGGQFVLRFEDTDKKREVAGSAEHLIASLKAIGIDYDEGPDIGGPHGPYIQSERLDIYKRWAQKLIDDGRAYADPYSPEEVQAFREKAQAEKRAFLYRNHRPENPPAWDGTTPLRFKSEPKSYTYHDEVMGDITTSAEVVDDFILIKSDGYPTYNFAHIIDDTEMAITHVIRGQEFISSMPNFLALYEALGFNMAPTGSEVAAFDEGSAFPAERGKTDGQLAPSAPEANDGDLASGRNLNLPVFAHMPHILNEQGNKKLGKRDGAKDVLDYIRDGYLSETMMSFIATMGWNDGTEQEIFTKEELIRTFSLDRVQRGGARFDEKRLQWMNGQLIRELSLEELETRVKDFWPESAKTASEEHRKQVLALAQDRLKTLADLPLLTNYFFEEPAPRWTMLDDNKQLKKLERSQIAELLRQAIGALKDSEFDSASLQETLNLLLETTGQKPGVLFSLVRLAVSWAPFSPALPDTLAVLGKDTTLARLETALAALK